MKGLTQKPLNTLTSGMCAIHYSSKGYRIDGNITFGTGTDINNIALIPDH